MCPLSSLPLHEERGGAYCVATRTACYYHDINNIIKSEDMGVYKVDVYEAEEML